MLICHCQVISNQAIQQAVDAGARTVGQVGRANGAGTCCGGCVPAIAELIENRMTSRPLPVMRLARDHSAVAAE